MPKGDREILKADPEDGHTPIANLLLEALAVAPLNGAETRAVIALLRETYGWANGASRHTEAIIPYSDWALFLNTNPVYAARILRGLVDKKVINRVDLGKGKSYSYSVNTRVNEWVGGKLIGLDLSKRFLSPPTRKLRVPSTNKFTQPNTDSHRSKQTSKEILNKYRYKNRRLKKSRKIGEQEDDRDRYIKGKYGHMVVRSDEDLKRIRGKR